MSPQTPNTDRTQNLTLADCKGKQKPKQNRAEKPTHRRRISPSQLSRPEIERLLTLAEFFPLSDALLVRELLGSGRSIAHVALLLGVTRHRIRSRLHSLMLRTTDPAFRFVISRRVRFHEPDDPFAASAPPRYIWPDEWSEPMRIAAQVCILDGRSCRDAARRTGMSYHTVRTRTMMLRELSRTWSRTTARREAS